MSDEIPKVRKSDKNSFNLLGLPILVIETIFVVSNFSILFNMTQTSKRMKEMIQRKVKTTKPIFISIRRSGETIRIDDFTYQIIRTRAALERPPNTELSNLYVDNPFSNVWTSQTSQYGDELSEFITNVRKLFPNAPIDYLSINLNRAQPHADLIDLVVPRQLSKVICSFHEIFSSFGYFDFRSPNKIALYVKEMPSSSSSSSFVRIPSGSSLLQNHLPENSQEIYNYGVAHYKMYGKNEQQALRPQFVLFNCTRHPQLVLLGVHRKENRYLKLEFEHPQHQFKVHSCDCQTPTMESDLNPLHTSHCSEIGKIVVDCWNSFNNKREQYVYNKESKILEQVHRSDIMFRPDLNISRHVMICDIGSGVNISIEKDADGLCQFRYEEGQTVKLPDSVVQQFVSDYDVIPEPEQPPENVFQLYFQTLPDFIALFCPCFNRINICVKITDGTYLKYYFNEKRMVRTINCPVCPEKITQNLLVPMYFDCREGQDNVIHCRNKTTNLFEQYIYDWNASELKQVFVPEFPYDGSRRQDSDSYFFKIDDIIISKEGEYLMLEILR
ncbi:hypothetical protein L5515_018440 [Caenorhabditis briggsae]|uniref:F-box domain-containing protein n=1 Tax=Caenorhabditis briggsae TaxID=6238 RepID=A0AAE9JSX0_CAEBR|nr:hypothetical protein L5515_018440 [Caenorhabditis briggsae]